MLLSLKNLRVSYKNKEVIKGVDLDIAAGENVALIGKNAIGKTTLANAIIGHPHLSVQGEIYFNGQKINNLSMSERSKLGIFLCFQFPPVLSGVKVYSFLRKIASNFSYKELVDFLKKVQLPPAILERYINEGFSGGERKRFELLQYLLVAPKLAIFDELDANMDKETLNNLIKLIKNKPKTQSIIWITHNKQILENINFQKIFILKDGKLFWKKDSRFHTSI